MAAGPLTETSQQPWHLSPLNPVTGLGGRKSTPSDFSEQESCSRVEPRITQEGASISDRTTLAVSLCHAGWELTEFPPMRICPPSVEEMVLSVNL